MTSMAISATPGFSERRHHVATTIACVALFWVLGALLATSVYARFHALSPAGACVLEVLAILVTAFLYNRLTARTATIDHALFVGVTWVLLSIATEIAMAINVHHGWYQLLGSPADPLLRNVVLFSWIGAPALFARYRAA